MSAVPLAAGVAAAPLPPDIPARAVARHPVPSAGTSGSGSSPTRAWIPSNVTLRRRESPFLAPPSAPRPVLQRPREYLAVPGASRGDSSATRNIQRDGAPSRRCGAAIRGNGALPRRCGAALRDGAPSRRYGAAIRGNGALEATWGPRIWRAGSTDGGRAGGRPAMTMDRTENVGREGPADRPTVHEPARDLEWRFRAAWRFGAAHPADAISGTRYAPWRYAPWRYAP